MATTVTLTPGPITVTTASASIVGGGNQWADESDATYAEMTTGSVQGDLALYIGPDSENFSYSYRVSTTGTPPCAALFDLYGLAPAPHFLMRMGGPDGSNINPGLGVVSAQGTGALVDWFAYYGLTAADFLAELRAGVRVVASTSAGDTLRVHRFTLRVTYEAFAAPRLRQYPRSPLRLWPPERSVQRSNRRAGGYR